LRRRTYTTRDPRDPNVEGVYAYGRRGLLGRRPAGYIVVRRAPVYRQADVFSVSPPPVPYPPGDYGYSSRTAGRQPIGHFSGQTGPNRWEYRPLYDDDVESDVAHDEVERSRLADEEYDRDVPSVIRRPAESERDAPLTRPLPSEGRGEDSEPEELPPPRETQERRQPVRRASTAGAARDIARDEARDAPLTRPLPLEGRGVSDERTRRRVNVPPPPVPDEGKDEEGAHPSPDLSPSRGEERKEGKEPTLAPPEGAPSEGPALGDPRG
jgi:hypothetical protein